MELISDLQTECISTLHKYQAPKELRTPKPRAKVLAAEEAISRDDGVH
jgi:hypothetical protein